ncbi:MAG: hypothetical protein RIQ98_829, partial [Bacteroidota bacterium]
MRQKYGLFLFFFFLLPSCLLAQSQLEVIRADSLNGIQQELIMRKTLIGHVFLRQGTTTLACDQAVLNSTTNNVEAYGHVKIIQADTVTITGDTAIYMGDSRKAYISGKVKLDDHTIVLSTSKLDYDLNSRMAIYHSGAKIIDKKSTLSSKEGFYNTVTKNFLFKEKVRVLDKEGGRLQADSLKYNTASKEAFFICPTEIITKKD